MRSVGRLTCLHGLQSHRSLSGHLAQAALPKAPTLCYIQVVGGSSSVVECFLAKEDVAGSTPVSRSKRPLSF